MGCDKKTRFRPEFSIMYKKMSFTICAWKVIEASLQFCDDCVNPNENIYSKT